MQTILTVNAGSSSLKCSLYELAEGHVRSILNTKQAITSPHADAHADCLRDMLLKFREDNSIGELVAIGHRVVHGGDFFDTPVPVDDAVMSRLRELVALAPLHQPVNLRLIEVCQDEMPGITNVACFDTAFHQSIPAVARNYALPRAITDAGVRAYGFHGLSYAHIWSVLSERYSDISKKRVIICHLGAGSSLCAIRDGHCIATTMGFSTAEGVPMATRTGSLDPGILIHLLREHGMSVDDLERMIYREGGLLGVSGISGNMRELRASTNPMAKEAIDLLVYRVVRAIGSLAAATRGVDLLVFTGGIGTHDALTRDSITGQLGWLGDNMQTLVIPTDEEAVIAENTAAALSRSPD